MKGWYVDKDTGVPLAYTEQRNKQRLADAGHPFINNREDPMPEGMHDPRNGQFAKWTLRGWVPDIDRETAWVQDRLKKQQDREARKTDLETLVDNLGNAATIRADLDRVTRILQRIYPG